MADERPALVANAAAPKQVRKARGRERWTRKQELEDVRAVLATEGGRRVLWRYIGICNVFDADFSSNEYMQYRQGMRWVGNSILRDVNEADKDAWFRMKSEADTRIAAEKEIEKDAHKEKEDEDDA